MRAGYICHRCGEFFAEPHSIDFVYSSETFADETKIERSEPIDVSPCCEEEYYTIEAS